MKLTGNATDLAVVSTFYDAITANHSYATGGSNSGECWQGPRDLGNFLDAQTQESCTQYNVLKVGCGFFFFLSLYCILLEFWLESYLP